MNKSLEKHKIINFKVNFFKKKLKNYLENNEFLPSRSKFSRKRKLLTFC